VDKPVDPVVKEGLDSTEPNDSVVKEELDSTKPAETVVVESNNSTYIGSFYSFEYPKTGWAVDVDTDIDAIVLHTPDYESGPMGLEKGSSIIMRRDIGDAEALFNSFMSKNMISDFSQVYVDGQKGYKFNCYEFCSNKVIFNKNSIGYEIAYASKDSDNTSVYNQVLNSFKVK